MQRIKYIILFVVMGYVAQSCSLKQYEYCKLATGRACTVSEKLFADHHSSELPKFKRKYKTKGIQVFLPQISLISFTQFNISNDYSVLVVLSHPTYKVEYVQGKRGPPVGLS
jgi:hypothetical protein